MPQILVGGDNQDAYSICDALETMSASRNQAVVFCATPHEVLSTVSRGGALAVVLNFEKAGLTNFELAYRIRESAEGHGIPLLLPEIDALGDVAEALGKQVGTFSFPVKPGAVAALACKLMDAAPAVAPIRPALHPGQAGPAASKPPQPDLPRPRTGHLDSTTPAPGRTGGAHPEEPPARARRVRHRSWQEVHSPRREPVVEEEPEDDDADEGADDPAATSKSLAARPAHPRRLGRLAVILGVLALGALSYYGVRFLRAEGEDGGKATPEGKAALVCVACDAREERPVQSIHDLRCRLCGGKLGFAFHCNDCKKDFGFIPPEKIRTLGDLKGKPECSRCKSWNTTALQPTPKAAAPPKAGKAPAATTAKAGKAPAETAPKAGKAPVKAPAQPARGGRPAAGAGDE